MDMIVNTPSLYAYLKLNAYINIDGIINYCFVKKILILLFVFFDYIFNIILFLRIHTKEINNYN